MSIQIIEGFKVNRSVPIDDRIVASDLNSRNNITYKYDGLRVFVLSDQTPYVWVNNGWKKEGENSLIGTSLKTNYLVKFNDINKGLTNSSVIDNGSCVFINHTTPPATDSSIKLNVNGVVKASSFTGIGTNLTNLNASEITLGLMDVKYLKPGLDGEVLTTYKTSGGSLSVKWDSISNIKGYGVNIEKSTDGIYDIVFGNESSTTFYINSYDGSMGGYLKYDSKFGQILTKNNGLNNSPSYSFIDDDDTGIYLIDVNQIGVSVGGDLKMKIDTFGIKISGGSKTNPGLSFLSNQNSGIFYESDKIGFSISDKLISTIDTNGLKVIEGDLTSPSISFLNNNKNGFYHLDGICLCIESVLKLKLSTSELSILNNKLKITGSTPTIEFDSNNSIGYFNTTTFQIKTDKDFEVTSNSLQIKKDDSNYFKVSYDTSNSTSIISLANKLKTNSFELKDNLTIKSDEVIFKKDTSKDGDLSTYSNVSIGNLTSESIITNKLKVNGSLPIIDILAINIEVVPTSIKTSRNVYLTGDSSFNKINDNTYDSTNFAIIITEQSNDMYIKFTYKNNKKTTNRLHFSDFITKDNNISNQDLMVSDSTSFTLKIYDAYNFLGVKFYRQFKIGIFGFDVQT